MKKLLLSMLSLLLPMIASAYDFEAKNADGVTIYYNIINGGTELEVTYKDNHGKSYSGVVNIPDQVTYGGNTLPVTSIGEDAFYSCEGLTSVTIPSSVIRIERSAFYSCDLSSVTIPNSVTSIGDSAFMNCHSLTSVTIPNSVTSIEQATFWECISLTSVIIPNSVTSIGDGAFSDCTNLTSVTIPNSVTSIGEIAFFNCYTLTSVTIPNSVTSIGDRAFNMCLSLTEVISMMENPCYIDGNCFEQGVFEKVTLSVPEGTIRKYRAQNNWNKFLNMEEIVSTVTSVKAATESIPVLISSRDGNLVVKSEQEGQSVAVYSLDGKALGSAQVKGGQAVIATNLPKGTIVVVKVGERSIKVKS